MTIIYVILWDCDKGTCGDSVFIHVEGTREKAQEFIDSIPDNEFYIKECEICSEV